MTKMMSLLILVIGIALVFPNVVSNDLTHDVEFYQKDSEDPVNNFLDTSKEKIETTEFFTENFGQWNDKFLFLANTDFGQVAFGTSEIYFNFLTAEEPEDHVDNYEINLDDLIISGYVVKYEFPGSNNVIPIGDDKLTHISNYFLSSQPDNWAVDVPSYRSVTFQDLWDGIGMVFYFNENGLKYDFIVNPGANLNDINIKVKGHECLDLVNDQVRVQLPNHGTMVDSDLLTFYQDGIDQIIESRYLVHDENTYGFIISDYDRTQTIVIDPVVYSTYVSGSGWDHARGIEQDSSGNTYVAGFTMSTDFPNTTGAYDKTHNGNVDACVYKLDSSGSSLVYSTFIGGGNTDYCYDISIDASGNAYVTGGTKSSNFPTSKTPYDSTHAGEYDVFAVKLNPTGSSLAYSTFIGHSGFDMGRAIEVDTNGYAYISGNTSSGSFPTTSGAYDQSYGGVSDAFVLKLNVTGDMLRYSTFLGGTSGTKSYALAIDSNGNAYVTGYADVFGTNTFPTTPGSYDTKGNSMEDVFVSKLNASGDKLLYSTMLGSSSMERGYGIDVDPNGYIYVAGWTRSTGFPTTTGVFQPNYQGSTSYSEGFITKLNITFDKLIYSTFLGNTHNDEINDLDVDSSGITYVIGSTGSTSFPTTPDAANKTHNGGILDAFLTKMNATGTGLLYSTLRGGSSTDYGYSVSATELGEIYCAGVSASTDFPTTSGAYSRKHKGNDDGVVFKFSFIPPILSPQNLTGTFSLNYVELDWDPPINSIATHVIGYKIYRGTELGSETLLTAVGNITNYNDTSITFGQLYYYYVTAINVTSESYPSIHYLAGDFERPRFILDSTPTSADAGKELTFGISVEDNYIVNNTRVIYWYDTDTGNLHNISMVESGNVWTHSIIASTNAIDTLHYQFFTDDAYGNWNETQVKDISLLDINRPIFLPSGDGPFIEITDPLTTGDNYSVGVHVIDLVALNSVWLEYWFGNDAHVNVSITEENDDWWRTIITVPHTLDNMNFFFCANDSSNNWNRTMEYQVSVVDNDNPKVSPNIDEIKGNYAQYWPTAYTGDKYRFHSSVIDNIAVDSAWVEYWYGSGPKYNLSMDQYDNPENQNMTYWEKTIIAEHTLEDLHFQFHANDTSDNWNYSLEVVVEIIDNDKPEILNDTSFTTATTGEKYTFSTKAIDNIEIHNVTLDYWFGTGSHTQVDLTSQTNEYSHSINIPSDSLDDLHYLFKSYDTSNNWNMTETKIITIIDNDPPEFWSLPFESNVGTGQNIELKTTVMDNIQVSNVTLFYWFGSGEPKKLDLTKNDDEYSALIEIPINSVDPLYFKISAMDTSGNLNLSQDIMIPVIDTIAPVIDSINDFEVKSGDPIKVTAKASDNIGVVELNWGDGPITPDGYNLSGTIDQPGTYSITVTAKDAAGNSAKQVFNITVSGEGGKKEGEGSEVEDETSNLIIIIVVVLVIVIILVVLLLFFRKKKTEGEDSRVELGTEAGQVGPEVSGVPKQIPPQQPSLPQDFGQVDGEYDAQYGQVQTEVQVQTPTQIQAYTQPQTEYPDYNKQPGQNEMLQIPEQDTGYDYGYGYGNEPSEQFILNPVQEQPPQLEAEPDFSEQPYETIQETPVVSQEQEQSKEHAQELAQPQTETGTQQGSQMDTQLYQQDAAENMDQPHFEQLICPSCGMQLSPELTVCTNCGAQITL